MSINNDALKNFQASNFNFVDNNNQEVDFNNLSDNEKYSLRDGKEIVQDNMSKKDVIDTINNEYGKKKYLICE